MTTRFTFLPIAVALAACLWVTDVMAQAVTIPAGASGEGRPTVPAGIGTHSTGERPGPGDRPGTARPAAVPALDSAAVLRQRAQTAMESLHEEIATLAALKSAQAALLSLNQAGSEAGEAPATLAPELCTEPALGAWCLLLLATFGTSSREDGHDRD